MELKSVMLNAFVQYILPMLATAIGSGLVWLLTLAGGWLKAKSSESKLAAVAAKVTHLVEVVVADLEHTIKPKIVEAAADGVITPEEGARLKAMALERIKAMLAQQGMVELQGVLGIVAPQVEAYLSGLIERSVAAQKEPVSAPVSPS